MKNQLIFGLAIAAFLGATGYALAQDTTPTDCAAEGRQKLIGFDNGVGYTFEIPNTATWCTPDNVTVNPVEDPTFIPAGGE